MMEIKKNYAEEKPFFKCNQFPDYNFSKLQEKSLCKKKSNPSINLIKKSLQEIFLRFPFNNFKYYFTLLSKFFSSFLHSTFSLSVFCPYLALGELHHPFWAAFPNNSTLRNRKFFSSLPQKNYRAITFCGIVFQQIFFFELKKNDFRTLQFTRKYFRGILSMSYFIFTRSY